MTQTGGCVVAVTEVPHSQTNRYGILDIGADDGKLVEVKGLVEKPKPEDAPSDLSIIGRYILLPEVITFLSRMERGAGNEVQLTDAMAQLIGKVPFHGLRYEGQRFDCGDKVGFLEAQIAFALKRPDMARRWPPSSRNTSDVRHTSAQRAQYGLHPCLRPDRPARIRHSRHCRHAPCTRRTPSPSAALRQHRGARRRPHGGRRL